MPANMPIGLSTIFLKKTLVRFAGACTALLLVAVSAEPAAGQQPLEPGEAFLTQFSGTVVEGVPMSSTSTEPSAVFSISGPSASRLRART